MEFSLIRSSLSQRYNISEDSRQTTGFAMQNGLNAQFALKNPYYGALTGVVIFISENGSKSLAHFEAKAKKQAVCICCPAYGGYPMDTIL